MKIKNWVVALALLGAATVFAADRNLTMHFIIDFSLKMQHQVPRSDKTYAQTCYDEFVGQMEALSKDEAFRNLRYRYDTVLQNQPQHRAKKGEWLHSSKEDQKTSGAIALFQSSEWLFTNIGITRRPHLTHFSMGTTYKDATETTDWDKYVKDMAANPEEFGGDVKDTLYIFFVYEKPKDDLIANLNKMLKAYHSRCIFIPMRRGTQITVTPENEVKRGFDEVAKLFKNEFGKNARISRSDGDLYPGKYVFRLTGLESDLPDGLEINWQVTRGDKPFMSIPHKSGEKPVMARDFLLNDAGAYRVTVELKTPFRRIPLSHTIEIRKPNYKFAVEVWNRSYGDGDTIRIESASKVLPKVTCEVTPKRELGNLRIKVKEAMYDLGAAFALYPNDSGKIMLYDVMRNRTLSTINFDIKMPITPLSLEKVTADGTVIRSVGGAYPVTLAQEADKAKVTFTLNRAARMKLNNERENAARRESWSVELAAGNHVVAFRSADGKSAEARVTVTKPETPTETKPTETKPTETKKTDLKLESVTANNSPITADDDGKYKFTLKKGVKKAQFSFTLNQSAEMTVNDTTEPGEKTSSWDKEFAAGEHTVVFRDGEMSLEVKISVEKGIEKTHGGEIEPPPDPDYTWLFILLGVAVLAGGAFAAKMIFGGKIFVLELAVNMNEYAKAPPVAKGRHRISSSMFPDCLGEFTVELAREKREGEEVQTLVFELPSDWTLSASGHSCELDNGRSKTFDIGHDEFELTTPDGSMKFKVTLVEK